MADKAALRFLLIIVLPLKTRTQSYTVCTIILNIKQRFTDDSASSLRCVLRGVFSDGFFFFGRLGWPNSSASTACESRCQWCQEKRKKTRQKIITIIIQEKDVRASSNGISMSLVLLLSVSGYLMRIRCPLLLTASSGKRVGENSTATTATTTPTRRGPSTLKTIIIFIFPYY